MTKLLTPAPLRAVALFGLTVALVACSDDASGPDDAAGSSSSAASSGGSTGGEGTTEGSNIDTGTVVLRFGVTNGVRMGPALVDPLQGFVHGQLFLAEDITLTGPVDGAVAVADVNVDGVDLVTDTVASVDWTSDPLPANNYSFLGFIDLDDNFEASGQRPDPGDPTTIPNKNFEIAVGEATEYTVNFDFIFG